jgi:hypothetical protein
MKMKSGIDRFLRVVNQIEDDSKAVLENPGGGPGCRLCAHDPALARFRAPLSYPKGACARHPGGRPIRT